MLKRPLQSHVYLHDVEHQRPSKSSESLNGVEECGTWTAAHDLGLNVQSQHEDSEDDTTTARSATLSLRGFPSRSPERTHMQYVFVREHIWTGP